MKKALGTVVAKKAIDAGLKYYKRHPDMNIVYKKLITAFRTITRQNALDRSGE